MEPNTNPENVTELRQDIVSGEWVVIATGRARRPHDFAAVPKPQFTQDKENCPFDHLHDGRVLLTVPEADPFVRVVKNKYPAFSEGICKVVHTDGIYTRMDGVGNHEVVVTADHARSFAEFTTEEAALIVESYKQRFLALKAQECIDYIAIFHNHGPESGATIAHPHSQIIAIPVIPPDVRRSLSGSENYFQRNGRCVHCDVIKFERTALVRKVYENEHCIVLCPYASRTAFEMRIFPKKHVPEFQNITQEEVYAVGDALQKALAKLSQGLNNPSYNFFIHTAPSFDHMTYPNYHWHIEILPKTVIWAGFEIGTGIEISTIAPESAAEFLRSIE